jgi:hypothetical protein
MSTHENTSQSRDVYQKVTDAIVSAIETAADWLNERCGHSAQFAGAAA